MESQINRMHRIALTRAAAIVALLALLAATPVSASETTGVADLPQSEAAPTFLSTLRSPEDGWLDASEFIDQVYGFMPIVLPITEPAVGFGAAGALAFIDRPKAVGVSVTRWPASMGYTWAWTWRSAQQARPSMYSLAAPGCGPEPETPVRDPCQITKNMREIPEVQI